MSEQTVQINPEAATQGQTTEAAPKPPKDMRNGITRPGAEGKCGKVWAIADAVSDKAGRPATRLEVVAACTQAGLEAATASTQFGRWRTYWGLPAEPRKPTTIAVDEAGIPLPVEAKPAKTKPGSKRSAKNGTAVEGKAALDVVAVVDPALVAVVNTAA